MSTAWSPKPTKVVPESPLFVWDDAPTIVKGLSPMERQRMEDGTHHTRTGPTNLRPADPELYISKGSLVEKYDERPKLPKQDPQDPMFVVKSYLDHKAPDEQKTIMTKSLATMNSAIAAYSARAGVKAGS